MWDKFKNLFKGQSKAQRETETRFPEVRWQDAADNPWRVPLLEVHSVTQTMLSTSENPVYAANAVSYGQDDGTGFIGAPTPSARIAPANLRYRIDPVLADGALFLPSVMEHKWALYYHQGQIYCIRSWKREVQAIAEVQCDAEYATITSVRGTLALTDETPEFTVRVLDFLLRSHALDLTYPAPIPAEMGADLQAPAVLEAAAMWCMSCYGARAFFATTETLDFSPPEPPLRTYSLLHIAAARADREALGTLLTQGLPVDLPDRDGQSPLHWALSAEDLSAAVFLLEHGAQIDYRDPEGATPLMQVVQQGELAKAFFLLDHGADPDAKDTRGFTALHRAAEMGRQELVALLLQRGADPNPEAQGHTPRSLAIVRGHKAIVALLDRSY